jgi:hypothetical protein
MRRRLPTPRCRVTVRAPPMRTGSPNQVCAWTSSDQIRDDSAFRNLSLVDLFTRECSWAGCHVRNRCRDLRSVPRAVCAEREHPIVV